MVKGTYEIVCSYPCFLIQCFSYPHVFSTCFSYTPLHPPSRKITWIMDPQKNYAVADGFLVQQSCDFQVLCVRFFSGEYTPVELVHPIRYPFFFVSLQIPAG